ncbi:hypothetical protein [Peribacillus butanolivorans]|uniref:hypothetical protein n=1 Tax=Peribacillus butanolivorans TaxID=421767 RepID=UPI003672A9D1
MYHIKPYVYGLITANGLGEAVTGKDMFGNQLTEEQRQNGLMDERGIFKQITDMYPNLKIKVSTEINPCSPYPRDILSF